MTREDLPDLLLAVLVLIVMAFAVSRTAADPDLWGHVRFGRDILASYSLSRHDLYSFTSDRPWVNHEWLAEALMAGAHRAAGSLGLIALKVMLAVGTFAVLWGALRRAGVYRPLGTGLLLIAVVGVYPQLIAIRPQLFSVLLYAVLLALLNGIDRGHARLWLFMPALFALWANLHGGWIVGLGLVGLWSACELTTRTHAWRWTACGVLLALLGTLATPYGVELWQFVWETTGIDRADIIDWQPLIRTPSHLIPWAFSMSLAVMAWRRRGAGAIPRLIPAVALGVLALRVVRLEGFFALSSVMLLAPCYAALGPKRLPLTRLPSRAEVVTVSLVCAAAVVATGVAVKHSVGCVTLADPSLTPPWAPEAEAITFLQSNPIHGRLLCWFDYGEMAIWHLAPKLLVSYDGRRETVYSAAVQADHLRFYSSRRDAGYARRLKADYVWLPQWLPVNDALEHDGWVAIFKGPQSTIYARKAGPYTQPAPRTGPRCFPGP